MARLNVLDLSANDLSRIEGGFGKVHRVRATTAQDSPAPVVLVMVVDAMTEARLNDYEAPLTVLRDSYDGGDPSWPTIIDLDYDPVHRLVLDLSRCCFASLSNQKLGPTAFALNSAMQAIGTEAGPRLFARVMAVAQSLETEREAPFEHLTVHCSRITPNEQAFMNAVTMARIGAMPSLHRATMALTGTDACPGTLATLEILGESCADLEAVAPLAGINADLTPPAKAN